ncbi:unnamed protein product [Phaeothamnion confervicola]
MRHGESGWNQENRWTSWVDAPLTDRGVESARECGRLLSAAGVDLCSAHTSLLSRSVKSCWACLEAMDRMWLPVLGSWRLNERHYGALVGLNKTEAVQEFGLERVKEWRRGLDSRPPPITPANPNYRGIIDDHRYAVLAAEGEAMPLTESLSDVLLRLLPYWDAHIAPELRAGRATAVVAHSNVTRALMTMLEDLPTASILELNVPKGVPIVYTLDINTLRPVGPPLFLGDASRIEAAVRDVAAEIQIEAG